MDIRGRFWNLPGVKLFPRSLKPVAPAAGLSILLALVVLVRCWNAADVFVGGKTFFVDPDCYSRMTRVQRVFAHPGTVIHRHAFENWPQGTQPHTTAPFDDLTAGLAGLLRPLTRDAQIALNWAGAWISPLLGLLTAVFLWFWAGALGLKYRAAMLFFFAVSPILVHGTVLGRPDHQSLLILCLAVALGAEAVLWGRSSRKWAIAGGLAWGLGLWVSLYEPLGLLAGVLLMGVAVQKKGFFSRDRFWQGAALSAVLLLAGLVDGWRLPVPDPVVRAYFLNWSRTIGELNPRSFSGLFAWSGWLLILAPLALVGLGWKRQDRAAWLWLGLLVAMSALTMWQARWGYFFALVFAMGLPWVLSVFPKRWMVWAVFAMGLWPLAVEWDRLFTPEAASMRAEQQADNLALYDVAQHLYGEHRLPILAPWWQSPALAYRSGQPCVAGSSHESLPGTVDASRFYLSSDASAAQEILKARRVACVVVYEPDRVNAVSRTILGMPEANLETMARILYERPHSPPALLELVYSNAAFRVFLYPDGVEP